MLKFCPRCKQEKDVNEFYKDKTRKDGIDSWRFTSGKINAGLS